VSCAKTGNCKSAAACFINGGCLETGISWKAPASQPSPARSDMVEAERESLETIQWRNIRKVVKELATFCFGGPDNKDFGACYIALVNSLTAKDGISVKMEPLSAASTPQASNAQERPDDVETLAWICKQFGWRVDGNSNVLADRITHHIRDLKAGINARDTLLAERAPSGDKELGHER
jgi:hypothetical protein